MSTAFSLNEEELKQFRELGFVGPFKLIQPQEAEAITISKYFLEKWLWDSILSRIAKITKANNRKWPSFLWGKARWNKGLHASVPQFYNFASNPKILDKISSILGDDILQWATHMLKVDPGYDCRWHCDAELLEEKGATVWLAVKNVTKKSGISIITRTHHLSHYPQQLKFDHGLDLGDDNAVLEEAQKLDPQCQLVSIDIKPGEFFIFAGSLWHSAKNNSKRKRTAIIFQYSPCSSKIRIPVTHEPPILWKSSLPPCILLKGKDDYKHNLIIKPPK